MKNNIKLLLLSLLTPLLCLGVSFAVDVGGNAGTFLTQGNGCNGSIPPFSVSNFDFVCVVPTSNQFFQGVQSINAYDTSNYYTLFRLQGNDIELITEFCFKTNGASLLAFNYIPNQQGSQYCANGQSQFFNYEIYGYSMGGGGNSKCESELEYLSGKYASLDSSYTSLSISYSALSGNYANCLEAKNILSGSLASCNSDLASCSNSCDTLVSQCLTDKQNAITAYSGCLEINSSLQNYNDSLSSQLQECLEMGTGGSGGSYIALYDLFRTDENVNYSLPIENNIWLPSGYRGYIDDGVLAIRRVNTLESAYSIDDTDFVDSVVGSYGVVFLCLMSLGFMLIFIYVIRRYFIGLKSIK